MKTKPCTLGAKHKWVHVRDITIENITYSPRGTTVKKALLDKLIEYVEHDYHKSTAMVNLDEDERRDFAKDKINEMTNVELVGALEAIGVDYA